MKNFEKEMEIERHHRIKYGNPGSERQIQIFILMCRFWPHLVKYVYAGGSMYKVRKQGPMGLEK